MKRLLILLAFTTSVVASYAQANEYIDGIKYSIYYWSNAAAVIAADTPYEGIITIPPTINYNNREYNVTSIDNYAFKNCPQLDAVSIPLSVTFIGSNAFEGCTSLASIFIPNNVKSLGGYLFNNCSNLVQVTLPNELDQLYLGVFANCTSLQSIILPESLECLSGDVFYGCSMLNNIYIPNKLTSLTPSDFARCGMLESITVASNNPQYDSRDHCNAIVTTAANAIIVGSCRTTIPNTITEIGGYAFYGRTGLRSITIPESVKMIRTYAFLECDNLNEVFCLSRTPPTLDSTVGNVFPRSLNFLLYVPKGCRYTYANRWGFPEEKIIEMDDMSIDDINGNNASAPVAFYNQQGQLIDKPEKGVVIARYKDGTTRKILVR